MDGYYMIIDLNKVGKIEKHVAYIYENGWVVDRDCILMDRIMGYDGDSIGNTDMFDRVESISEEKAIELINLKN